MTRLQTIPDELKQGPITVAFAEGLGISRHQLRGPNWRRIACGIYVWAGLDLDRRSELVALHRRLPRGCVFSGQTAAQLHGLEMDGGTTVAITVPPEMSVRLVAASMCAGRRSIQPT